MFGKFKDFLRIAIRYDRLATKYLAAICLAAIVSYWLWVWSLVLLIPTNQHLTHRGQLALGDRHELNFNRSASQTDCSSRMHSEVRFRERNSRFSSCHSIPIVCHR